MIRPDAQFEEDSDPISSTINQALVTIVASSNDPASQNIADHLLSYEHFLQSKTSGVFSHPVRKIRLVIVEKPCIYVGPGDIPTGSSSIIFASKHVSSTNTPAVTVHATGNLTESAEFGGKPEEVSFVEPARIQRALRSLRDGVRRAGLRIDVTMEATHHGPTEFQVPVCFVEVGSGPSEWSNNVLGGLAASAIMEAAAVATTDGTPVVGFGGTHYSAKLTRACLEGKYQIGHIVPRHAFESQVADSVIRETIRRTRPRCKTALVDWKGLTGNDRRSLVARLESWECKVVRC